MVEKIPIREGTFIKGPNGETLIANSCKSCAQTFFPKAEFCLSCFGEDLEELKLSRRGKLYSYTISHMPSSHFEPPYAVGYVDMPEGVRIFAPLKIIKDKPFVIDMKMEVIIEKLWQDGDKEVIGYKFRPI